MMFLRLNILTFLKEQIDLRIWLDRSFLAIGDILEESKERSGNGAKWNSRRKPARDEPGILNY